MVGGTRLKRLKWKQKKNKSMLLIHRSQVLSEAAANDKLISGRVHVSVTPESESCHWGPGLHAGCVQPAWEQLSINLHSWGIQRLICWTLHQRSCRVRAFFSLFFFSLQVKSWLKSVRCRLKNTSRESQFSGLKKLKLHSCSPHWINTAGVHVQLPVGSL